jgi:chemotaxis protein methyltransferase WspC
MSLAPITDLLREHFGLDPETLSQIGLRANVRRRMEACGCATRAAYAALIARDPVEFRALVYTLVVHETSFFRYPASYDLLARHALERKPALGAAPFRVLSVACSTGEEPASVVMALLGAGLTASSLRVDASDISERALDYARAGRYRRRGVERMPSEARERWLVDEGEHYRLRGEVIASIRYRQANALAPDFLQDAGAFDAIFCRNLLIYLVPKARTELLGRLTQHLRVGGLLFVGHAEVPAARALGMSLVPPPDAFAVRRTAVPSPPAAVPRPATQLRLQPGLLRPRPVAPVPSPPTPPRVRAPLSPSRRPVPLAGGEVMAERESPLDRAARLADAGDLDQARRILSDLIAQGGATADHYHLLAVIEGARGRDVATSEALRRALYLDPEHYPALVQLALLADARGERERARRARAKAERVRAAWDAARGAQTKEGQA